MKEPPGNNLAFSATLVGFCGIVAQIILLRQLLVRFHGNELTLGVILAVWLCAEGAGALAAGRLLRRADARAVYAGTQLLFAAAVVASLAACRAQGLFPGVPRSEGVGLTGILAASTMCLTLSAFLHGALFSCLAAGTRGIGAVYAWETCGAIAGGLAVPACILPLNNDTAAMGIVAACAIAGALVYWRGIGRGLRAAALACAGLLAVAWAAGGVAAFERATLRSLWAGEGLVNVVNSRYGNIAVVRHAGQCTYFYDGVPLVTLPQPHTSFNEELIHLPLSFHPDPRKVLLIGGGAGGLVAQSLRYPQARIEYAEADPALTALFGASEFPSVRAELNDPRVRVRPLDGRAFLRAQAQRYDCIISAIAAPESLNGNRFFSEEFFRLARSRLAAGGLCVCWLPGSTVYLGYYDRRLHESVRAAMAEVFRYVRVLPGEVTLLLGSDDRALLAQDGRTVAARFAQRGLQTDFVTPAYVTMRMETQEGPRAAAPVNTDQRPYAVYCRLAQWTNIFSGSAAMLRWYAAVLIVLCAVCLGASWRTRKRGGRVLLCLGTTGFAGMALNLILIFRFQSIAGYIYHYLGILLALYMAGAALGCAFTARLVKRYSAYKIIVITEVTFVLILAALPFALRDPGVLALGVMFLIAGCLTGWQFPVASACLQQSLKSRAVPAQTAGILYWVDLSGGTLAALSIGIFCVPISGITFTLVMLCVLKIMSCVFYLMDKEVHSR